MDYSAAIYCPNLDSKHTSLRGRELWRMRYEACEEFAETLPETVPPLVVDIDGTLTNDRREIDPRSFPLLRAWPAPLVVATGKSMPYPVALCEFLGIEHNVIAENGGVVLGGRSTLEILGAKDAAADVLSEYRDRGYDIGWADADLVNRWRETELTVSRESPRAPLEAIAEGHGLEVIDTGYAYHIKSPDITKGAGLSSLAPTLKTDPGEFIAIGDSVNDVSTFDQVKLGVAVANADEQAREAADYVTTASFGDGFIEAIEYIVENYR